MRRVLWIASALMALALVGGAAFLLVVHKAGSPGPLSAPATVTIDRGSSLGRIAETLQDAGVIADQSLFALLVKAQGAESSLIAGEYRFDAGISLSDVIGALRQGAITVYRVTIPEGLTSAEVIARLRTEDVLSGSVDAVPPEGTLLPDTYQVHRGDTRQSVVDRMQESMAETLDRLWPERADDLPLIGKEEAVILASIVEKETGVASERARVAGVFINRLKAGMRLQTDPTVIYALTEGAGPLGRPLTRKDLEVASPYNTYIVAGLPPGPIANPGEAAIAAALNPETHGYYYFVADGSGGHAFSKTLAEHNRNVARWRQVQNGGG